MRRLLFAKSLSIKKKNQYPKFLLLIARICRRLLPLWRGLWGGKTLILFFTSSFSFAQTTLPITLEKALELGAANNLTIKQYQQQKALADAELAKAKEWWLPQIYAGLQTHQLSGAAMNGNGRFFIDIDRDNLWAGLGLDMNWDFSQGIYAKKAAVLKANASQFQSQAAHNHTLLEIIETYYDLVNAQLNFQTYQQLVAQADTLAQQINIQVEAGLRYQSEWLLSKSNANHLKVQMLQAKVKQGKKSAELVQLLNLDPSIKLVSVDSIISPITLTVESLDYNQVYQRRPEIQQENSKLASLEIEKKTVTTGLLIPEFRLNTYGAFFGDLNSEVTPTDPTRFTDPNQFYGTRNLNMAFLWEIPLGVLTQKGDIKKYDAKIALQQNQVDQIKAEINAEILAAETTIAANNEQLQIAKEGSELAAAALQQSYQRQTLGTIRPFEILQAQEVYIKAQLDYIRAVASYNTAQYQLYVAKGNNL